MEPVPSSAETQCESEAESFVQRSWERTVPPGQGHPKTPISEQKACLCMTEANVSDVGLANKRPCHRLGFSVTIVMVPVDSLEFDFLKWILFIFH